MNIFLLFLFSSLFLPVRLHYQIKYVSFHLSFSPFLLLHSSLLLSSNCLVDSIVHSEIILIFSMSSMYSLSSHFSLLYTSHQSDLPSSSSSLSHPLTRGIPPSLSNNNMTHLLFSSHLIFFFSCPSSTRRRIRTSIITRSGTKSIE